MVITTITGNTNITIMVSLSLSSNRASTVVTSLTYHHTCPQLYTREIIQRSFTALSSLISRGKGLWEQLGNSAAHGGTGHVPTVS